VPLETLIAYWVGELDVAGEAAVEEHFFACASCARRLDQLAALASGIRAAVRNGAVRAFVTRPVVEHLKGLGMRLREYRVGPGERVACTLGADDDGVVSHLRARLDGVARVDALESLDVGDGRIQHWRLEDVPFDAADGEVVSLPSTALLRALPAHTYRVRLVAVDDSGERTLGDYTFDHTPG
jgi:hypothetical protein